MNRIDDAAAILVSLLRGERKPPRRKILAAHAKLLGLPCIRDGLVPTARQLDVLMRLDEYETANGQPAKLMDLAAEMGVTKQALSGTLKELRLMGLAENIVSGHFLPRNLRVSPAGRKWLEEHKFKACQSDEPVLESTDTETAGAGRPKSDD